MIKKWQAPQIIIQLQIELDITLFCKFEHFKCIAIMCCFC